MTCVSGLDGEWAYNSRRHVPISVDGRDSPAWIRSWRAHDKVRSYVNILNGGIDVNEFDASVRARAES